MSSSYCLNTELVLERAIDKCIANMDESNYLAGGDSDAPQPNPAAFENNLENGTVALVLMRYYLEGCLNTLIHAIYGTKLAKVQAEGFEFEFDISQEEIEAVFRRRSVSDKVESLVKYGHLPEELLHTPLWHNCLQTFTVANELGRYKTEYHQETDTPDYSSWHVGDFLAAPLSTSEDIEALHAADEDSSQSLGTRLTRPSLQAAWDEIKELTTTIVEATDCRLDPDAPIVSAAYGDEHPESFIVYDEDPE